jgi:type I restriction enzyme S subunit
MSRWPKVALGEICSPAERQVIPVAGQTYRQLGVRLWGEGAYEREAIDGANTKYAYFNRIEADNLVVNKIWARNGSVAVTTPDQSGTHVSIEFPIFALDHTQVNPGWMRLLTKWRGFWAACDEKAQGTSGKNRIKPQQFLSISIPLPSLDEQRAIVARLDAVAEKARQVEANLDEIEADLDALCRSFVFSPQTKPATLTPMRELLRLRQPDVFVDREQTYHFAGVYSFGRGVFKSVIKSGSEFAYEWLSILRKDDFTYPKLMAWEGALGVVPAECDGLVVSPEFPVFTVNTDIVLPEVLDVYFRTPQIWSELAAISTGTNQRRRRLQPSAFLEYQMPVPPMSIQKQLREIIQRRNDTNIKHAETRQTLKALLSSMLENILN